jgi:hypothetical protein
VRRIVIDCSSTAIVSRSLPARSDARTAHASTAISRAANSSTGHIPWSA